MRLIATLIYPCPLDELPLAELAERRSRGFHIALLLGSHEVDRTQERLLERGACDAAIVCRQHSPLLVSQLLDADETHVVN